MDYENCRHLTVVGLRDTGPWSALFEVGGRERPVSSLTTMKMRLTTRADGSFRVKFDLTMFLFQDQPRETGERPRWSAYGNFRMLVYHLERQLETGGTPDLPRSPTPQVPLPREHLSSGRAPGDHPNNSFLGDLKASFSQLRRQSGLCSVKKIIYAERDFALTCLS